MSKGVPVGLRNVHYAAVTQDDETGVTYSEPVKIADAITVNVKPSASLSVLYADDGPSEVAGAMGEITLEFSAKSIPTSVEAELLGSTFENGIMREKTTDIANAPYVAFGYERTMSNGKKRFVWLLKGKFMPGSVDAKTKEGSVSFQPDSLGGMFVRRSYDDEWRLRASEDDVEFTGAANWFTAATLNAPPAV